MPASVRALVPPHACQWGTNGVSHPPALGSRVPHHSTWPNRVVTWPLPRICFLFTSVVTDGLATVPAVLHSAATDFRHHIRKFPLWSVQQSSFVRPMPYRLPQA